MNGHAQRIGEAFPPLCNIEDKLDELVTEREWLLDMCKKGKLGTYDEGKETTLVRIIIRPLPKEYEAAVKSVRDLVRFRKAGAEGTLEKISKPRGCLKDEQPEVAVV